MHSFNYEPPDDTVYLKVGDIVRQDGKPYKVTKVTKTALAVTRYYWFDSAFDYLAKKFGGKNGTEVS